MPITAEQVIKIIDYAIECSNNAKEMRRTLKRIEEDAKKLLYVDGIEESVLDQIASIRTSAEDAYRFEINQDSLENLFMEKQRFMDNAKKNKNSARRMRMLREGIRQREYRARDGNKEKITVDVGELIEEEVLTNPAEQETAPHPWYGPCDALMPDGSCVECKNVREWQRSPTVPDSSAT